jgi:hypothetical protein
MKATLSVIDLELKGLEKQRTAGSRGNSSSVSATPTPDRSQQGDKWNPLQCAVWSVLRVHLSVYL